MAEVGFLTMENGWAVEAWFWASAPPPITTGRAQYIFSQDQQISDVRRRQALVGIRGTTGFLCVRMDTTSTAGDTALAFDWVGETDVCDSSWHHVAVTMASDRRTCRIFLDGELVKTVRAPSTIRWTGGGVACFAGQRQDAPTYSYGFFNGRIAYCAFKDAFVPNSRIYEHYRAGSGGRVFYDEDEVTRMTRVLDWAETPREARALDPAVTRLMGFGAQGANNLQALQEQAKDAGGYVYADGQGVVRYHNRRRRYNRLPVVILSEENGTGVEADLQFEADHTWIANDIRGHRPYGPSFRMENAQSRQEFGRRIHKVELNVIGNDELKNAMSWLLYRYSDQHVRVPQCSLLVENDDATLWPFATGAYLDVGDKIQISGLPDNAPSETMEFFVEGISVDVEAGSRWVTRYSLSPGDQDYVWQLDATEWWGALDDGAPLGY
jgi:hypothetical protein